MAKENVKPVSQAKPELTEEQRAERLAEYKRKHVILNIPMSEASKFGIKVDKNETSETAAAKIKKQFGIVAAARVGTSSSLIPQLEKVLKDAKIALPVRADCVNAKGQSTYLYHLKVAVQKKTMDDIKAGRY